jgi:hypothetical protein
MTGFTTTPPYRFMAFILRLRCAYPILGRASSSHTLS